MAATQTANGKTGSSSKRRSEIKNKKESGLAHNNQFWSLVTHHGPKFSPLCQVWIVQQLATTKQLILQGIGDYRCNRSTVAEDRIFHKVLLKQCKEVKGIKSFINPNLLQYKLQYP
jgi:hypothetical protein